MKMQPQIIGLQRQPSKASSSSRHRAHGAGIIIEGFEERASKSDTLHREASYLNVYDSKYGLTSGRAIYAAIEEELDELRQTYTVKTGKHAGEQRSRKLKSDCVYGVGVIYNPPEEWTLTHTVEECRRLVADAREVMAEISPVFAGETIGSAEHWDEWPPEDDDAVAASRVAGYVGSWHVHDFKSCMSPDGKCIGSGVDFHLRVKVGKEFPRMMRERGWDIEDLDMRDWDLYLGDDEEAKAYKKEWDARQATKREDGVGGLSVNAYRKKRQEKAIRDAKDVSDRIDEVNQAMSYGVGIMPDGRVATEADRDDPELIPSLDTSLKRVNRAKARADKAEATRAKAEAKAETAEALALAAQSAAEVARARQRAAEREAADAERERAEHEAKAAKAKAACDKARKAEREAEADADEARRVAKALGPAGRGVDWTDTGEHEHSIAEVRERRDELAEGIEVMSDHRRVGLLPDIIQAIARGVVRFLTWMGVMDDDQAADAMAALDERPDALCTLALDETAPAMARQQPTSQSTGGHAQQHGGGHTQVSRWATGEPTTQGPTRGAGPSL